MAHLERLERLNDHAFYKINGNGHDDVDAYVVTTPYTRKVCNKPEILGAEFRSHLERAVVYTLTQPQFKDTILRSGDEATVALAFLRGGLNFRIWEALCHQDIGLNEPLQGFMTSQRRLNEDGTWAITDDAYRKVHLPKDAVLIAGDIVATGSTIDKGLEHLEAEVKAHGNMLEHMILFTIGCENTEEILARHHGMYKHASVVYFEGRFGLAARETKGSTKMMVLPDTDLLRYPALLTPEFEESQYENEHFLLERCTIYDGGARSFKSFEHRKDVIEYWESVRNLAKKGFTLAQALTERWPEDHTSAADYVNARSELWKNVPEGEMNHIYARSRMIADLKQHGTAERLLQLAEHRIERMRLKVINNRLQPYGFEKTG